MICGLLEKLYKTTGFRLGAILFGVLCALTFCFVLARGAHAQTELVWITRDFSGFSAGTLDSSGANLYVSRKGVVEMINMFDLNHDGHLDILFNQSHDYSTKVNSSIYWNSKNGFEPEIRSVLPARWRLQDLGFRSEW